MGASGSIENKKIVQIVEYYFLQRKIEDIFTTGTNRLYNEKKHLFSKLTNPNDIEIEQELYIIDHYWLENWKAYSNYNKAKEYFDNFKFENGEDLKKQVENGCVNMLITGEINKEGECFPTMNNEKAYENFCNKLILDLKNMSYLVTEKCFISFLEVINYKWNPEETKTKSIKSVIRDKVITLIFENQLKFKFIYLSKNKNKHIYVTADFAPDEFNLEVKKSEAKSIYKDFLWNQIRNYKSKDWFEFFDKYNIENSEEVYIDDGKYKYKLRNEELCLKNIKQEVKPNNKINFNLINYERLIGLENIGATCYMNATLQCFINIDLLTRYLLNESNYKLITDNNNSCELTSSYCEVLMNVCCNIEIENYYKPKDFKRIISIKNPLFKGIRANDSKDLIYFMIEEMNNELNSLFEYNKINNIFNTIDQRNRNLMLNYFIFHYNQTNKSVIPRIFYSINEMQNKCLSCQEVKYNYQVSFMFDFVLNSIYNYCKKSNIPAVNNKGKVCLSLYNCFEGFSQPSFFTNDNKIYCNNCRAQTNALYTNYIYSLSPIIIISLNRGKDNVFKCIVDYPEELNLSQYVLCPMSHTKYKLKGVITHLGSSGMSGHFIAFCRQRVSGKWCCFNDNKVTYCQDQENDYKKGTPYILFYESMQGNNNLLYDLSQNNINNNNLIFNNNNYSQFNLLNNSFNFINNVNNFANSLNQINNNNLNQMNNINMSNMNIMNNSYQMNNMMNMNINNQMNNNNQANNMLNMNQINNMNNNINNNNLSQLSTNMNNNNTNQMNNNNNMNQMNSNMNQLTNNMNQSNNNMNKLSNNMNQLNNNMNQSNNNMNQMNNNNVNQMNNNKMNQMNNNNMNQLNNNFNQMNSNMNQLNNMNPMNSNINSMNNNMNWINNNMIPINNNRNSANNNMNSMSGNINQKNNILNSMNNNININQVNNTLNNNMNNNMSQSNNSMNNNINYNMNSINNNNNNYMNQNINNLMNNNMNCINNNINLSSMNNNINNNSINNVNINSKSMNYNMNNNNFNNQINNNSYQMNNSNNINQINFMNNMNLMNNRSFQNQSNIMNNMNNFSHKNNINNMNN